MGPGIGCSRTVGRVGNGWRCELTPNTEPGRRYIPDQPIVGFGATEDEAKWDAIQAFGRALGKLTPEQRAECEAAEAPLEEGARLVGAADHDGAVQTTSEAEARAWAAERIAD